MADTLRATPQNPYTGALARGVRSLQQLAAQYQVDPRVPLLGGTSVDELLSLPGAASVLEDVSYNGPRALIRGGNAATGGLGTYKLDPRVADLADVATMAAPVAQGATRALVNLPRSVARAGRDFATSVSPVHVVKPKGGNWLAGSVEQAIAPMKSYGVINSRQYPYGPEFDAASRARIASLRESAAQPGYNGGALTVAQHLENDLANPRQREVAVNRWLDQKLAKYIRNEMATPEDPVRALAERGVLHVDPEQLNFRPEMHGKYMQEGQTAVAQSPMAKSWEGAADINIAPHRSGELLSEDTWLPDTSVYSDLVEKNPWLAKVPPETPVYSLATERGRSSIGGDLGLTHLVDELRNATDPESTLPAHLRWKYQDLDKVTVPQAVERVADINAWRAAEAARAEREGMMANLNAAPRLDSPNLNLSFVDKPGGKWVDIPDTGKDGMPVCTSIGKAGGWCTQAEWAATEYGSGPNRLTALLDAEGRPHAQVKITNDVDEMGALSSVIDMMTPEQEDAYMRFADTFDRPVEHRDLLNWVKENEPALFRDYQDILKSQASGPPDITELKPVGNTFDSARAQDYTKRDPEYRQKVTQSVLDFLNAGEWGQVRDLHHYDIADLDRRGVPAEMRGGQRFVTEDEYKDIVRKNAEGFAAGGLVSSDPIPYDSAKIDAIVNSLREEY